jgi:hypothetical protein
MLPREALSGEALLGLAERLRKTLAASQDARGKVSGCVVCEDTRERAR